MLLSGHYFYCGMFAHRLNKIAAQLVTQATAQMAADKEAVGLSIFHVPLLI